MVELIRLETEKKDSIAVHILMYDTSTLRHVSNNLYVFTNSVFIASYIENRLMVQMYQGTVTQFWLTLSEKVFFLFFQIFFAGGFMEPVQFRQLNHKLD